MASTTPLGRGARTTGTGAGAGAGWTTTVAGGGGAACCTTTTWPGWATCQHCPAPGGQWTTITVCGPAAATATGRSSTSTSASTSDASSTYGGGPHPIES